VKIGLHLRVAGRSQAPGAKLLVGQEWRQIDQRELGFGQCQQAVAQQFFCPRAKRIKLPTLFEDRRDLGDVHVTVAIVGGFKDVQPNRPHAIGRIENHHTLG
jgi:hypothetical protein